VLKMYVTSWEIIKKRGSVIVITRRINREYRKIIPKKKNRLLWVQASKSVVQKWLPLVLRKEFKRILKNKCQLGFNKQKF